VIDGETGILATLDDPGSFAEAIGRLDELGFTSERAVASAERFSVEAFRRRLSAQVTEALRSDMTPRSLR
jgi:glycosyltransferase involved in cell wall biosynthesis